MRSWLALVHYTVVQQFRHRVYLVILLFGGLLVGSSLLFGAVSGDQELRIIFDLGLSATELFGLVTAVFGAVTLVLEEMESRTIYLILTRPVPRWVYILGRVCGLVLSVWLSVLIMGGLHLGILLAKGWTMDPRFFLCFPFIGLKVLVITALAVFFSLFSTSAVSSVIFSSLVWVLGHFGPELRYLAHQTPSPVVKIGAALMGFFVPRLELLNYRDVFEVPSLSLHGGITSAAYGLLYTAACLCLSLALFRRKEF